MYMTSSSPSSPILLLLLLIIIDTDQCLFVWIYGSLYLPAEYVSHVHYPRPRLRVTAEAEALPVAALC